LFSEALSKSPLNTTLHTRDRKASTKKTTSNVKAHLDRIDGESMSGSSAFGRTTPPHKGSLRLPQSPGTGGFSGTPLFLYPRKQAASLPGVSPLLGSVAVASILPSNADLLRLMLTWSTHRSYQQGVIQSWMEDIDPRSPSGAIRLLSGLSYLMVNGLTNSCGSTACILTWPDIQYLFNVRETLEQQGNSVTELTYVISLILEDTIQKDLSLKFRLENILDFNDQITVRGWADGGSHSDGTHTEELRIWFTNQCVSRGIGIDSHNTGQDLSPVKLKERINLANDRQIVGQSVVKLDPFRFDMAEQILGSGEDTCCYTIVQETPRTCSRELDRDTREIIVVDVQTDHNLRRHINKASELRKQARDDRSYINELKKYIQRRIFFETPETRGTVLKLATAREGFVHIGDIRAGASSRHFAILFKTLCDATGVYCRLVRGHKDAYYNVVMITEGSRIADVTDENRRESNDSAINCRQELLDVCDEESLDDAPEELIPVFWESTQEGQQKRVRLTHPLDSLLQKCNSAADPVDLDDFFVFDCLLGKGSFGEVWKVNLQSHGRKSSDVTQSILLPGRTSAGPFALKLIPPEESDKEEASFMRIYSHARIIRVIAVFRGYQVLENRKRELEKKPAMCILMEMAAGCLESMLPGSASSGSSGHEVRAIETCERKEGALDLSLIFRILIDSARAMVYLHSPVGQQPHLVHRDLKPGNILITSDFRAIVTDFGVARVNPSLETNLTVGAGTEGYMAPEQKTLLYDRPADVYSFGVIIARLLGVDKWNDATSLRDADFEYMECDPFLSRLCLKCVQSSPLHRPSFEQIHQVLMSEFVRRAFCRQVGRFTEEDVCQTHKGERAPVEKQLSPFGSDAGTQREFKAGHRVRKATNARKTDR
jgi:serine/threonine protein kinase